MARKYSLCPLFFLAVLAAGILLNGLEKGIMRGISSEAQAGTADAAWQDPFYTGKFGVRTWTDVTGEHRVEGRFVELLSGKVVRLQRTGGRFLRIKLDELSRADRELVRGITRK